MAYKAKRTDHSGSQNGKGALTMVSAINNTQNHLSYVIFYLRIGIVLLFTIWCSTANSSLIQGSIAKDTLLELDVSWSWNTFDSETNQLYFADSSGHNSLRSTNTRKWRLNGSSVIINNATDNTLKVVIHIDHLGFILNPDHNHIGSEGGLYSFVNLMEMQQGQSWISLIPLY